MNEFTHRFDGTSVYGLSSRRAVQPRFKRRAAWRALVATLNTAVDRVELSRDEWYALFAAAGAPPKA